MTFVQSMRSNLRKGTIVPQIAFVREAIADESKLALLDVLFDWVEEFLFGNLLRRCQCLG